MTFNEIAYIIAYCLFLAGAAKSFRDNGSAAAVRIMSAGVALDFLVSMLPVAGVAALKMEVKGSNGAIVAAIVFGFVVWMLFAAALLVRRAGRMRAFHVLVAVTEIAWFIDFITFLYGIYKFPLK
jgi:hypothetical protein